MNPLSRFARLSRWFSLAGAFAVFALQTAGAQPQVAFRDWDLGYPHVSGTWLTSVCWGAPGCVAVGWYGEILFSPNGADWTRVDSPLQRADLGQYTYLWDVCYGNGAFVAVGGEYNKGRILRSPDGLTWTEIPVDLSLASRGVAFGDGLFAVVAGTKVLTSADGLSWQQRPDSPGVGKIAHGNGKWVGTAGRGRFVHTTDFVVWDSSPQGWPSGNSGLEIPNIAYANGKFLAVGGWNQGSGTGVSVVMWSEDGVWWNDGESSDEDSMWGVLQGCAGAGGRFAMVGMRSSGGYGFVAHSSPDADTWTRVPAPAGLHTPGGSLQDVAGAEGRPFVAVASTGQIWKSADGTAWEIVAPVPREYVEKVRHADGKFVAVGGSRSYIGQAPGSAMILSSPDGLDWVPFIPDRTDLLSDVTFGEGLWVATGDDGGIFTSPDSLAWTDRSIPGTVNDLGVVVYGAGRFIAFSSNRDRIYHSVDGLAWQVSDGAPVAGVNAAEFIEGRFIAVGNAGLVLSSEDGLNWSSHGTGGTDDLLSICRGKGRYVAGGLDHTATSEDGISWQWHPNELAPRVISYLDGWFVSDDFRVSRDGVVWTLALNDFPRFFRMTSMVVADGSFVGAEGLELWKGALDLPRPEGLTVFPGSGVEVRSLQGVQYRLKESLDLKSWITIGEWRDGNGDYLRWPVEFSASRKFWNLESR